MAAELYRTPPLGWFFNIEQIEDLVLAISAPNLTNRFNESMKTPVDVWGGES
ncbi:MAG: hypothetical protein WAO35_06060 [Terriglobia bacterium]